MISTRFRIIFLIIIVLILNINSIYSATLNINHPNYFEKEEGKTIKYLDNELLSFEFCEDEDIKKISAKLTCNQDNNINAELELFPNYEKSNCYFSNYELNNFQCDSSKLEIKYISESKEHIISQNLEKEKESNVLKYIFDSDISTLDTEKLSYYTLATSIAESTSSKKTTKAYQELKNQRNNGNKCWPKDDCDVSTTNNILLNLKLSGFENDNRLIEDGKNYLEKRIISSENYPLKILINFDDPLLETNTTEINCDLTFDDQTDDYVLDENYKDISLKINNDLTVSCDTIVDEIDFYLFDLDGNMQFHEEYLNKTSFTYEFEDFACLGIGGSCNYEDSISPLILYGTDFEKSDLISDYINSKITEDSNERYVNTANLFQDMGKYLYYDDDTDMLNYLKFKQNNDGSWGSGKNSDRVEKTFWSILGIEKNEGSESENVKDAKNWLFENEPTYGWGDIKLNTLSYYSLQDKIKPRLTINKVNNDKGVISFKIANPSVFNINHIEISFSDSISSSVSFSTNIDSLKSEEEGIINVSANEVTERSSGYLYVKGYNEKEELLNLISIPLNLEGTLDIQIEKQEWITMGPDDTFFEISPTVLGKGNVTCNYYNPLEFLNSQFTVSNKEPKFKINNNDKEEGNYNFSFDCNLNGVSKIINTTYYIDALTKEFGAEPREFVMDKFKDVEFEIDSLDGESHEITVSVSNVYDSILVPVEEEFTLYPGVTKEVKLIMGDTTFLELLDKSQLEGYVLLQSSSGYELKVPIVTSPTDLSLNSGSNNNESYSIGQWIFIMVLVLVIAFIALIAFRYRQLKLEEEEQKKTSNNEEDDDFVYLE